MQYLYLKYCKNVFINKSKGSVKNKKTTKFFYLTINGQDNGQDGESTTIQRFIKCGESFQS